MLACIKYLQQIHGETNYGKVTSGLYGSKFSIESPVGPLVAGGGSLVA